MTKAGRKPNILLHDEIIAMYEAGIRDMEEFTSNVEMSEASIRRVLAEKGYILPRKQRNIEEVEGICADYNSQMPVKEILVKWSISVGTLYTILFEQGIPTRNNAQGVLLRKQAAASMYAQGVGTQEIISETRLSTQSLYTELIAQGQKKRSELLASSLDKAITMYSQGAPINEINVETGISTARLYQEMIIRNIPKRGHTIRTDENLDKALLMYSQGTAIELIYIETKISPALLYRTLRMRGLSKRGHTGFVVDSKQFDRAVEMYQKGETLGNIFEETHIKPKTLYTELRQRGLELRP